MTTCPTTAAGVLVALVVAGCGTTSTPTTSGPPTVVFADEQSCRTATGAAACSVVLCDYVPEGRTFEEVCGVNFQEGIQVTSPDTDDWATTFLVDQLTSCDIATIGRDEDVERDTWVRADGITWTVVGGDAAVESALATAVDSCATRDTR